MKLKALIICAVVAIFIDLSAAKAWSQLVAKEVTVHLEWSPPAEPVTGYEVGWWIGPEVSTVEPMFLLRVSEPSAAIKIPISQTTTFAVRSVGEF